MIKEYFFVGETDKNPLSYKLNEQIIFTVTPRCGDDFLNISEFKNYKWQIEGDDGRKESGSCPVNGQEPLVISTFLTRPGFVRVIVEACDGNLNPLRNVSRFEGGAGAEIKKIMCDSIIPEDFDEFWEKVVNELDECGIIVEEKIPYTVEEEGFSVYKIKLKMPYGNPVWGLLSIPNEGESFSAKVVYRGYGIYSVQPVLEREFITFAVDVHGLEPGLPEEYYKELGREPDGELYYYGFNNIENSNPDNVYFKNVIARDLMAAKFVKALPQWNRNELVSEGGSQGAFRATSVAAWDKDITKLNIDVPWFCNLGGYKNDRMRGWSPDYTEGLCYYDTANQATRVKCPVSISAKLGDYICPPSSVVALYNNLKGEKKIYFYQNGTHSYTCPVEKKYTLKG